MLEVIQKPRNVLVTQTGARYHDNQASSVFDRFPLALSLADGSHLKKITLPRQPNSSPDLLVVTTSKANQ